MAQHDLYGCYGSVLLAAIVAAKWRMQWKVNGFTPAFLHNPARYLGYCL
jgi:hypothetical protein